MHWWVILTMTNADKYLKDGVTVEQMRQDYNKTGQTLKSVFEWLYKPQATLATDEIIELKRLCEKVVLSFKDEPKIINLLDYNDRFDYHESTNRFDLEISIRKREKTVDEMLKREPPKKYGTMELFE